MALPYTLATLTAGNQPLSKIDANFAALGAIATIPGTVTGTNTLAFTPATGTPAVSAYNQYQAYRAAAVATSSGAVTFQYAALAALAVYVDTTSGPVAAGSGDIVDENLYDFIYDSALNTGAGGFHAVPVPRASYATGTFTPGLAFGGGSTGMTFSSRAGRYTRVGNRVFYELFIILSAKGSSTGAATVTGLPIAAAGITNAAAQFVGNSGMSALTVPLGQITAVGTTITLVQQGPAGTPNMTDVNFTNASFFNLSGEYEV